MGWSTARRTAPLTTTSTTKLMKTAQELIHLLRASLGLLDSGWQSVSGHTRSEAFTIIRYDGLKKGELRRMHALIEDLLSKELGEGDRA
tara:strand:- start:73 stop:339 length:267 start_codon:yes stop_codon:yes gene_type:complete